VRAGLTGQLEKYAEALELMWFQYVVGYDKQEQRSLATALSNRLIDYRRALAQMISTVRSFASSHTEGIALVGSGLLAAFLLVVGAKRVRSFGWRRGLSFSRSSTKADSSTIAFYERLTALLARQGVERNPDLTPLEFAVSLGLQPALAITRAYNRVRFGGQHLSAAELCEIDAILKELEEEPV
jgi:hypothetical protein